MDYEIRKATVLDLEQIRVLLDKLCKKEFTEFDSTIDSNYALSERGKEFLSNRLNDDKDSFCLVALKEGLIIGYFIGGINEVEDYRTPVKIGEGESTLVDDKYRGQGIGTKFLGLFEKWCKDKELNRMRLVASSRNEEAVKLYKKLGYNDYDIQLEKEI